MLNNLTEKAVNSSDLIWRVLVRMNEVEGTRHVPQKRW